MYRYASEFCWIKTVLKVIYYIEETQSVKTRGGSYVKF